MGCSWMVPAGRMEFCAGWRLAGLCVWRMVVGRTVVGRGGGALVVGRGWRVVAACPVGAALFTVLMSPPPGRLCFTEVWNTPVFWLKDSWLSNWF